MTKNTNPNVPATDEAATDKVASQPRSRRMAREPQRDGRASGRSANSGPEVPTPLEPNKPR